MRQHARGQLYLPSQQVQFSKTRLKSSCLTVNLLRDPSGHTVARSVAPCLLGRLARTE